MYNIIFCTSFEIHYAFTNLHASYGFMIWNICSLYGIVAPNDMEHGQIILRGCILTVYMWYIYDIDHI